MTQTDLQTILKKLEENREERETQHKLFSDALIEINEKLDPVYKIYSQFSGFGTIAIGFFKWVIVPISVILGIFLSLKQFLK